MSLEIFGTRNVRLKQVVLGLYADVRRRSPNDQQRFQRLGIIRPDRSIYDGAQVVFQSAYRARTQIRSGTEPRLTFGTADNPLLVEADRQDALSIFVRLDLALDGPSEDVPDDQLSIRSSRYHPHALALSTLPFVCSSVQREDGPGMTLIRLGRLINLDDPGGIQVPQSNRPIARAGKHPFPSLDRDGLARALDGPTRTDGLFVTDWDRQFAVDHLEAVDPLAMAVQSTVLERDGCIQDGRSLITLDEPLADDLIDEV